MTAKFPFWYNAPYKESTATLMFKRGGQERKLILTRQGHWEIRVNEMKFKMALAEFSYLFCSLRYRVEWKSNPFRTYLTVKVFLYNFPVESSDLFAFFLILSIILVMNLTYNF